MTAQFRCNLEYGQSDEQHTIVLALDQSRSGAINGVLELLPENLVKAITYDAFLYIYYAILAYAFDLVFVFSVRMVNRGYPNWSRQ